MPKHRKQGRNVNTLETKVNLSDSEASSSPTSTNSQDADSASASHSGVLNTVNEFSSLVVSSEEQLPSSSENLQQSPQSSDVISASTHASRAASPAQSSELVHLSSLDADSASASHSGVLNTVNEFPSLVVSSEEQLPSSSENLQQSSQSSDVISASNHASRAASPAQSSDVVDEIVHSSRPASPVAPKEQQHSSRPASPVVDIPKSEIGSSELEEKTPEHDCCDLHMVVEADPHLSLVNKLQELTKQYQTHLKLKQEARQLDSNSQESMLIDKKLNVVDHLLQYLNVSDVSEQQKLQTFAQHLNANKTSLSQHRTPDWQRYVHAAMAIAVTALAVMLPSIYLDLNIGLAILGGCLAVLAAACAYRKIETNSFNFFASHGQIYCDQSADQLKLSV